MAVPKRAIRDKESVMSLYLTMMFNDQPLARGTGFLVRNLDHVYLVTARHNLTGIHPDTNECLHSSCGIPNAVQIMHNTMTLGRWTQRTEPILDVDGASLWLEHPKLGPAADLAALRLTDLEGVKVRAYSVDDPNPRDMAVGVTDAVSVIGFPFGITGGGGRLGIWVTGTISTEPEFDYHGQPKFLIDCRSRQGQSGSPVLAFRRSGLAPLNSGDSTMFVDPIYRFMGLYSGRINSESDLGIVWNASAIAELIFGSDLGTTNF